MRVPLAGLLTALTLAGTVHAAPLPGALTAAEVRAQIVGHSVVNADKTMTWYYHPGGKLEDDDGRNYHAGTYKVEADGRLCWKENDGMAGCFQYVRKGKALILHRVDPGHQFELGPVTVGPLNPG